MALCIRVPKEQGESVRSRLISSDLLDLDVKIKQDGDHLLIPILSDSFENFETVDAELEATERRETDYRNLVNIPEELKDALPSSFDVIGDIAIVKLPDEVLNYADRIGNALLKVTPSIKAVMLDRGVKGEFRVRDVTPISGSGRTETIHKEFGVTMSVDPGKVYFNPRLSTERMRIALMVKEGETIIDMFAGVAPFSLVISKHSKASVIYAVDMNKDAVEYMKRNIKLNKVTNIVPMCGDAREVIKRLPSADRVIMNLPHLADSFLPDALSNLKKGGTAHLHKIMDREGSEEMISDLIFYTKMSGYDVHVENVAELKTYSPSMSVYVLDVVKE